MELRLTGSVLFVKDIQASRRFYEEVLEQKVDLDLGLNIGYVGGLALWQRDHAHSILFQNTLGAPGGHNNNVELYFETSQLDEACQRVEAAGVEWVNRLFEQPWAQRAFRFYDPDGHIIEIGEPMPGVITRLLAQGMSVEAIAQRTAMPLEMVRALAGS
ncbi:MAG: VOC family protein [Anaerolineaceae bacterium]|nr:VOC family protein [Anaerolineaceae bacterium]